MPRPETRTRRRSPEYGDEEDEYMLFLQGIPPSTRWQELKDLAKEYGIVHYRSAETIPPQHDIGFIFVAGRKNAEHAFNQFCERGWRRQSIFCTLNGPVTREQVPRIDMQSLRLMAGHGPTKGPVYESRTSQHQRPSDQRSVNANMANSMQQCPSPMPTVHNRSPTTPVSTTASSVRVHGQGQRTTYPAAPAPQSRHAPDSPYNGVVMQMDEFPGPTHNRHSLPVQRPVQASTNTNRHYSEPPPPRAARPAAAAPSQSGCLSIRIDNLKLGFRDAQALLEQFGPVQRFDIQLIRDGRQRVRSTVVFGRYTVLQNAAEAIRALNGRAHGDRALRVGYDFDAERDGQLRCNRAQPVVQPPQDQSRRNGNGSRRLADNEGRKEDLGDDDRIRSSRRQSTRGPLVVDGARGSGRRRRDVRSRDRSSSEDDSGSDSDASDEQRESRRRRSGTSGSRGSCGDSDRGVEILRNMTRTLKVN